MTIKRTINGVDYTLVGESFDKQIFPGGEPVFTQVDIKGKHDNLMGRGYFTEKMSEDQIKVFMGEMDVEPFLFAIYK